jgi:ABC-type branched-subunit amino acid transport system substrate-binding protein
MGGRDGAGGAGTGGARDASDGDAKGGAGDSGAAGSMDGGRDVVDGSADSPPTDGSEGGSAGCRTNRECATSVPAVCLKPEGKCVELLSADCKTITGDYLDDNAVLLGTLFSTSGVQAATNLQRQRSATLAFEEINSKGGLPPRVTGGLTRPIVAVSCDEANSGRAVLHLIQDLRVPAIVGPTSSQDAIDLSNGFTVPNGTVMLTPTAIAGSIVDLQDNDLTWLMAPSDVQRAPILIQQINALETQLKAARAKSTIKFGLVYRNDAVGRGTRTALVQLQVNGKPLTDPANATSVRIDPYDPSAPNQDALVAQYQDFAPDIVALAGAAEAITGVMGPLEASWNVDASADRPYYVTIESAKVPELLAAATNADLRGRIRGSGISPTVDSAIVRNAFMVAYRTRYGSLPTSSNTSQSYDAAYAIAYAIAAIGDLPVTGANIAARLRRLSGGPTVIEVGSTKVFAAFQKLTSGGDGGGENITLIGTFAPLEWDANGAVANGLVEMWCIGAPSGTPVYGSSGLVYDLKTKQFTGTYTPCP